MPAAVQAGRANTRAIRLVNIPLDCAPLLEIESGYVAKISGHSLMQKDAEVVLGMVARGDREHDIAAYFGVNQGRIAEVKKGEGWSGLTMASAERLPPQGAPGIKGRRLRDAIGATLAILAKGEQVDVEAALKSAAQRYDANEA